MEKGKSKKNVSKKKISPENKKLLVKWITYIVLFLIVMVVVTLLCKFVIEKFGRYNEIDDGVHVSNNRVSNPDEVIEHDPEDGMYIGSISSLIAGGEDCNSIEEFANDKRVEAKDVSQLRAFYAAEADEFYNNDKKTISLDEFTAAVKELFGDDYEFKPEEIDFDKVCSNYKYESSSKKFVKNKKTCKISCDSNSTSYKLVKVVEEYGKYTIDVKVLFGSKDGSSNYYSDFNRENAVEKTWLYDNLDYSKGATYRFVFESKGSNYYFTSSELVTE